MGETLTRWVRKVFARPGREAGASLAEVLVATAILVIVLVPMLDFSAYMFNGHAFERQLAATLAASKMEELANKAYRSAYSKTNPLSNFGWPGSGSESILLGNYEFGLDWTQSLASSNGTPERYHMRRLAVRTTCYNCRGTVEAEVVTYIAKMPAGSTSE